MDVWKGDFRMSLEILEFFNGRKRKKKILTYRRIPGKHWKKAKKHMKKSGWRNRKLEYLYAKHRNQKEKNWEVH